jgi:hypothetical protein
VGAQRAALVLRLRMERNTCSVGPVLSAAMPQQSLLAAD